jgi:alkylhydroperoxidase family enzyme
MLINAVPREEMTEDLQSVYDHLATTAGDTKFAQAGANAPEVFDWWTSRFYEELYRSGRVDPRIKEVVRMRLSKAHGCALCNRLNTYDSLAIGIDQETIDAIGIWPDEPDSELLTEADLAAIAYADQMIIQNMDGHLDADIYAELRRHFDDGQIFELGITMGILTGVAKFLFVTDMVPREENCPIPERV